MNDSLPPLADLVLAWLLVRKRERASRAELAQGLRALLAGTTATSASLDAAVDALVAAGLLDGSGRALQLTDGGRDAALRFLGLARRPARLDWRAVQTKVLPYRLLGWSLDDVPAGRVASEVLTAAVLVREESLPVPARAPARSSLDAIAWRALGVETHRPFSRDAVLEHVLGTALGGARFRDAWSGARLLAAKHLGARRADPEGLRSAVVRRHVDGASPPPPAQTPASDQADLEAFARRVLEAARGAPSGRFGEGKVFISHVHRQLRDATLDLDRFKSRLVEAQRAGLVALSRADLVGAMPLDDVRASETRNLGANFHFVCT